MPYDFIKYKQRKTGKIKIINILTFSSVEYVRSSLQTLFENKIPINNYQIITNIIPINQ